MANDDHLGDAWEYARGYYKDESVVEDFEILARFQPELFEAYITMRQGLFKSPPEGALDAKTKELVILGIECIARKTNPPPVGHTRRALESGATAEEIAEVVGLCIMLGGMITFRESGRFVLRETVAYSDQAVEEDAGAHT